MNRYRWLLLVLTLAAALPLAADDPTPADSPSPDASCDTEFCKVTDELVGRALVKIQLASTLGINQRDLRRIAQGLEKKCAKSRRFDAEREMLRKLIEKLPSDPPEGGGPGEHLLSAQAWLNVSKEWEELERRCLATKTEPPPLMQQNPQIDFLTDLTEDELWALIVKMTELMRKRTREVLLRPNQPGCSEHNRQIIVRLINEDGSLQTRR